MCIISLLMFVLFFSWRSKEIVVVQHNFHIWTQQMMIWFEADWRGTFAWPPKEHMTWNKPCFESILFQIQQIFEKIMLEENVLNCFIDHHIFEKNIATFESET
jgi:hypothetical protein